MPSYSEVMAADANQPPFVKPYLGHLDQVPLSFIELIDISKLKASKLQSLRNGVSVMDGRTFSDILSRPPADGPIELDISNGRPYTILNGRHRVHLAREQGLGFVMAHLQGK